VRKQIGSQDTFVALCGNPAIQNRVKPFPKDGQDRACFSFRHIFLKKWDPPDTRPTHARQLFCINVNYVDPENRFASTLEIFYFVGWALVGVKPPRNPKAVISWRPHLAGQTGSASVAAKSTEKRRAR
jgi:hypothetical protein